MVVVDLVVSGLGTIRSLDDVTPVWVAGLLRHAGLLDDDVRVTGVEVEPISPSGAGFNVLQRVRPTYSAPTAAPETLVVKYAADDEQTLSIAQRLALGVRECIVHELLAETEASLAVPCYGAGFEPEGGGFTLATADLGPGRERSGRDGLTASELERVILQLASFHAYWRREHRLDALHGLLTPLPRQLPAVALAGLWCRGWRQLATHAPEIIPTELRPLGLLWARHAESMHRSPASSATLCHGDLRVENIRFDRDEPVLIDFQSACVSNGLRDLASLVCHSTDARSALDGDGGGGPDDEPDAWALALYVERLSSAGVHVELDTAWQQYRSALLVALGPPMIALAGPWPEEPRPVLGELQRIFGHVQQSGAMAVLGGAERSSRSRRTSTRLVA